MKKLKISFLIPAHNEEKVISKTIENLLHLPYNNYEVIIGLDGCTDNTEEIVKKFCKKSKKFRYYKLNLRQGKPAVIDRIIKKAYGEIIIINDADWIFFVKNKEMLEKFLSVFNDKKIGGIAESFPVEWDKEKIKKGNLGYKMVAYSSYFWLNFQKEKFAEERFDKLYVKDPKMFLTNIFRRKLYKKNKTLGDDFERSSYIKNRDYELIIFKDPNIPKMVSVYNKIFIKDLFKQKIRTAIARKQIKKQKIEDIGLWNYYIPSIFYILKTSWKDNINTGFIVSLWMITSIIATFFATFNRMNTREGWKLRMER